MTYITIFSMNSEISTMFYGNIILSWTYSFTSLPSLYEKRIRDPEWFLHSAETITTLYITTSVLHMNTVTEMSSAFDVTHEDLFTDVKKGFPVSTYTLNKSDCY